MRWGRTLMAVAVLLAAAAGQGAGAGRLLGVWRGTVEFNNNSWPVVLHVVRDTDPKSGKPIVVGVIDNVDPGEPPFLTRVTLKHGKVHLEFRTMDAAYDGRLNPHGTAMAGHFAFAGIEIPCLLELDQHEAHGHE